MNKDDHYFDFLEKIFPSFSYENFDKDFIKKLTDFTDENRFVMKPIPDVFSQGDIFSSLPMTYFEMNDNAIGPKLTKVDAILLSNTCDSERKDNLSFAPLVPISLLIEGKVSDEKQLRSNVINDFIYLPHEHLKTHVIDLNQVFTLPREFVKKAVENGKIKRNFSLKKAGYYLLLSKIAILFCRLESEEVIREN